MKKLVILFVLFVANNTFSQNNSINITNLSINGVNFNQTVNSFINIFGSPSETNNYYNELSNENWLELNYNSNLFYFDEDVLIEFSLKNNTFYFVNPNIYVGMNILDLEIFFPQSLNNKKIINDLGFIRLDVKLENGDDTDMFIIINYNKNTLIVTSIHSATS